LGGILLHSVRKAIEIFLPFTIYNLITRKTMTLQQKFLHQHQHGAVVTTSEIVKWYASNKRGDNYVYHTTVYQLIINPLTTKGNLLKISRGVYEVNLNSDNQPLGSIRYTDEELDEWSAYIDEKIKTDVRGGDLNA
jgi:hypothetical protein